MKLVDVYDYPDAAYVLYELLREREPRQNISHREMPSWEEHCAFVTRRPYADWRIIVHEVAACGAVYLTHQREIGVGILQAHRGYGLAAQAIEELMRLHPGGRFLANINPRNEPSIRLFQSLGFRGPIQVTYERP